MSLKKALAAVVALCMSCTMVPVVRTAPVQSSILVSAADEAETGTYGVLTYKILDNCIEISGCDKTAESVEIPAEIEGLPVTSIGTTAFYSCALSSVTIPESVTSIGAGAFWHCKNLGDIALPSGVTVLNNYVFADCAFTSFAIPETVTEVYNSVFSACTSLEEIVIPETVTYFGNAVFDGTPWLDAQKEADPFVVVNGILIDASRMIDIILAGESVAVLDEASTEETDAIEETEPFTEETDAIEETEPSTEATEPIEETEPSTEATEPIEETEPSTEATEPIEETEPSTETTEKTEPTGPVLEVVIPEGITTIGEKIFGNNAGVVTRVVIPESVTAICKQAFYSCRKLSEIEVLGVLQTVGDEAFEGTAWLTAQQNVSPLVIVNGVLIDGKKASGSVVIPEGVTSISGNAFWINKNITDVTFPEGVESIGVSAFYACTSLTSVQFPESLRTIEEEAFSDCGLTEVTIPEGVEYIAPKAFVNCVSLPGATLHGAGTVIAEKAFGYTSIFTLTGQYAYVFVENVNNNFTFNCVGGGTSERYAAANNMKTTYLYMLGDLDADDTQSAVDASLILVAASKIGSGSGSGLTEVQDNAADVNLDGTISALDASAVLQYASAIGSGKENIYITDFTNK